MLHQAKGERGYQALKEDTALARSDPTIKAITFDLHQTLAMNTESFVINQEFDITYRSRMLINKLSTGLNSFG